MSIVTHSDRYSWSDVPAVTVSDSNSLGVYFLARLVQGIAVFATYTHLSATVSVHQLSNLGRLTSSLDARDHHLKRVMHTVRSINNADLSSINLYAFLINILLIFQTKNCLKNKQFSFSEFFTVV